MDNETKKEFENLVKLVKKGFDNMEERMATKEDLNEIREDMATKEDLNEVKENMATKEDLNRARLELMDHTEEKAADIKGSLVLSIRKQDRKVNRLIEILKNKKHLTNKEEKELIKIRPFSEVR